ncbi:MAG: hypothetical protein RLY57_93 [Candidatus Parcubacteria bacterium]|jgi:hypothetical protein
MRILYNVILFVACVAAPWFVALVGIVLGGVIFNQWYEGIVAATLLDIMMFGGEVGYHTLYVMIGFCGVYYVTMRFKEMLRVA